MLVFAMNHPFFAIFIDIESTGLHFFRHRPIEVALVILSLPTGEVVAEYESLIYCSEKEWSDGSSESRFIHGIPYSALKNAKTREEVGKEIKEIFSTLNIKRDNGAFIGQNSSMDRIFFGYLIDPDEAERLRYPYYWLETASMQWARHMLLEKNSPPVWRLGFSKNKIANYYDLPPEGNPHRAMAGVKHLIECYRKMVGFEKVAPDLEAKMNPPLEPTLQEPFLGEGLQQAPIGS